MPQELLGRRTDGLEPRVDLGRPVTAEPVRPGSHLVQPDVAEIREPAVEVVLAALGERPWPRPEVGDDEVQLPERGARTARLQQVLREPDARIRERLPVRAVRYPWGDTGEGPAYACTAASASRRPSCGSPVALK